MRRAVFYTKKISLSDEAGLDRKQTATCPTKSQFAWSEEQTATHPDQTAFLLSYCPTPTSRTRIGSATGENRETSH